MPPKTRYTKEIILNSAFQLVKEKGIEAVNAREVAKHLGCSTQPIFHVYSNMDELIHDLYLEAEAYYNSCMENALTQSNPFLGVGLAYIQFAHNDKNLFKLLFMTNNFKIKSAYEMIENDEKFILTISNLSGLSCESTRKLYINMWLLTHGIASMMATNSFSPTEDEVLNILNDSYQGLISQLTKETT